MVLRAWLLLRSRGIAADAESLAGTMLEAKRDMLQTAEADSQLQIWRAQAKAAKSTSGRIRGRR